MYILSDVCMFVCVSNDVFEIHVVWGKRHAIKSIVLLRFFLKATAKGSLEKSTVIKHCHQRLPK